MRELLSGYATAVGERVREIDALGRLRRDLEAFATALVHFEDLRRVLTDPGIAVAARRSVLRDLLEGRALPEAVDLLSFAAAVERAAELPRVVSQLLADLDEQAAGETPGAVPGRRAGRERLRGYAQRVLQELPGGAEVDDVEDELFRFARILDASVELRRALADPQSPLPARLAVLEELLAGKVQPHTLRLARFVLLSGQQRDLVGIFELLAALAAEERGRRLAEVRSAVDLDEDERNRLAAALARIVERPVEVRVIEDPSVVGGALVTVGDLVIDGTLRLRLERLRDALVPVS